MKFGQTKQANSKFLYKKKLNKKTFTELEEKFTYFDERISKIEKIVWGKCELFKMCTLIEKKITCANEKLTIFAKNSLKKVINYINCRNLSTKNLSILKFLPNKNFKENNLNLVAYIFSHFLNMVILNSRFNDQLNYLCY